MKIRNKILVYFSATVTLLTAIALFIIYLLFSSYREEEFQQRQKEKITSTLHFIAEVEKTDKDLAEAIDRMTLNSLLDEKLLIFDNSRKLIYSSLDDLPISYSNDLLNNLSINNNWIERKDGQYDVVAIYFKSGSKYFYGISKAYDKFGYLKLTYLRNILFIVFAAITLAVLLVSLFLAGRISKPIDRLANLLGRYQVGEQEHIPVLHTTTHEINYLNEKFQELADRTREAFAFQKHSIHHISHQLKTPVAVLVSELEVIKNQATGEITRNALDQQIDKTKSLADVINVLLEISKSDSGQPLRKEPKRIDEIAFDAIEELTKIHPGFHFDVQYSPEDMPPGNLTGAVNEMLIRQVFQNLLGNCIAYSSNNRAEIQFNSREFNSVHIAVMNRGKTLSNEEEKFLFDHFFRGENSRGKIGFGLGLVLTKKIISLHGGTISYAATNDHLNTFLIQLPLS
ncbi:sensor histidine kinase [Flavihumibacter petaseus]|uniref:histidine kinase n=1 Tax=Flavihumibacter petaseus NBRC 106054 TaxID=1220578 RepID=A0A0E9N1C6_9BACT|nr:HAMP domain-containing sensor histidine kinase [Flavihumibacter petaseus]GAO43837.1 putative two-component histidine kinase [Flavihumibacter petaseus NBRC 106054]